MKIFNEKVFSRELGIIFKDHSIILTVLIAPILYAFFLGSIYLYKDADQINFAVVDIDRTPTTPFFNGFLRLSVMGGGWQSIKTYALHLMILVLVSFVAVVLRWRYLERLNSPQTG